MMLEKPPDWWDFELELSPHLEDRIILSRFLGGRSPAVIEVAQDLGVGKTPGRWIVRTSHLGEAWDVVVEPDELDRVIVVITAYKVTTW
jgi:hypothetical protein